MEPNPCNRKENKELMAQKVLIRRKTQASLSSMLCKMWIIVFLHSCMIRINCNKAVNTPLVIE